MTATIPDDAALTRLATQVGQALQHKGIMLAAAESCTGGWVAQVLTSVAGSSQWFERGFVAYSNVAKRELLDVRTDTLVRFGAVSEQIGRAMAEGALARSQAQVTLAVTGIAGPGGGSADKPVGTVWFAWAGEKRETRTLRCYFPGDREAVRRQAVAMALSGLLEFLA